MNNNFVFHKIKFIFMIIDYCKYPKRKEVSYTNKQSFNYQKRMVCFQPKKCSHLKLKYTS